MTLTQLSYILAVDRYRSFSKAAKAVFVSQPTLSMQLKKLEEELGVPIFDRSRQPVVPTPAGEQLIAQARVVLNEADKLTELVQETQGELSGELRLGIIPTISPYLLHRFLARFVEAHPKVQLSVEEVQTSQMVELLRQDLLDVGIAATPLNERNIVEEPLYYEPFMAYVPDWHRLSDEAIILASELDLSDILLLNEGHCFRNNVINLCGSAFNPDAEQRFKLQSGNFETLIRLAHKGFGMTLLPYLAAIDLKTDRKAVKPFGDPQPSREVSLLYSRSQLKTRAITALREAVLKGLPKRLQTADRGALQAPTAGRSAS